LQYKQVNADLKARLNEALTETVGRYKGSFTGAEIARDLKITFPVLWEEVREVLATERLVAIATGMMRGPLHQPNSAQLPLAGFEDLPKYIRAGRRWVDIRNATAEELAEFAEWYRERVERNLDRSKRDKQILTDVNRLVRVMKRYDRRTPGITVGEVLEIREARAELNREV
jgi:hypothetical protein